MQALRVPKVLRVPWVQWDHLATLDLQETRDPWVSLGRGVRQGSLGALELQAVVEPQAYRVLSVSLDLRVHQDQQEFRVSQEALDRLEALVPQDHQVYRVPRVFRARPGPQDPRDK